VIPEIKNENCRCLCDLILLVDNKKCQDPGCIRPGEKAAMHVIQSSTHSNLFTLEFNCSEQLGNIRSIYFSCNSQD